VERWHAVVVSRDSVSGIPYQMPLECDSCRRIISLTYVDSLQAARPSVAQDALYVVEATGALVLLSVGVCSK
jgi:hypothetical protein